MCVLISGVYCVGANHSGKHGDRVNIMSRQDKVTFRSRHDERLFLPKARKGRCKPQGGGQDWGLVRGFYPNYQSKDSRFESQCQLASLTAEASLGKTIVLLLLNDSNMNSRSVMLGDSFCLMTND